eukprot:jgi/Psemu1/206332/e_gw1.405.38.1
MAQRVRTALLDVLRQTIGKYVKNLDPESLNVAVWDGKIELNSLELDVESINMMLDKKAEEAPNLAMPFKVISGRFESFQVDVPWTQLTSRSVTMRARGLSVIVEPLDRSSSQFFDDDEPTDHDMIRRVEKQRELREHQIEESNTYRLQAYELRKIAFAADDDDASDGNEGTGSTFAQRLARRIVENIQIEISDVHISMRNEDGAVGIVLESLKLMTTDSEGNFVFVDRTGANRNDSLFRFKLFRIQGLGIYLDEDDDNSSVYSRRSLGHTYVLAPLSFETMLRIADKSVCESHPMYQLRSQLSVISFRLTRNQVDIVRKVANIMSPSNLGPTPLFPEYRPAVLVRGHAKVWWKYAARCIGRLSGRRLWIEFFRAYKKRKQYIPLFKRHSHHKECPWVKPLTNTELSELFTIEQDRSISVEGLMTWRNIADGQIDKERAKRKSTEQETTTSYFSYVFGSRKAGSSVTDEAKVEEPAIVLSVDEMKELEGISRSDLIDPDMAKDAKYYDVNFVLDAMKIDLIGYDLNHVALLDMGKVSFDFDARIDGAFTTSFDLYDLEVLDRTTPNSLFPSVLKKIDTGQGANTGRALHLGVSKSATGDQSALLKMVGFQLVASKLMAQELQHFFQDSSNKNASARVKANPLLRKSISGSVDLFYDASEGDSIRLLTNDDKADDATKPNPSPEVKEILSNKLIDVWKKKSQSKVSWTLDVDVKAPVVLIPQACNDPGANVMVFDLGNLKVKYGKGDPSASIQEWFDKYPRDSLNEDRFETGSIDINDLTFTMQKASYVQSSFGNIPNELAIIDPIGIRIDFAVEDIGPDFEPRSCFLGVIPTISLRLSPLQGSQILGVMHSWTDMFTSGESDDNAHEKPVSSGSPQLEGQPNFPPSGQLTSMQDRDAESIREESYAIVYCRIGLQRLTVTIIDEGKKQLEANLVSVYASILQCSDESSVINLKMGWFWILDWIATTYARKQRLVIHSKLPCSAEKFAESNRYNVIEELTKQGVFERHYSGSTELADVTFKTLPRNTNHVLVEDIYIHQNPEHCISTGDIRYILDVKFRSLVIHWNPHVVKEINALSDRFLEAFTGNDSADEAGAMIVSAGNHQKIFSSEQSQTVSARESDENSDPLLIMAELESLGIILNSARDDLPLFALTVSGTRASVVPHAAGQEISLSLGDLRIATPENTGRTLPMYRTLLGIEDDSLGSLLTVKYCAGRTAIETLGHDLPKIKNLEAVADIELSAMRFCFIQSQVLTLSNYITEGVLGALTAKAAISAAEAAKELGNSVSGNAFYRIRATSFEAIVPEAAYRQEHMRLKTATLSVDYSMFSDARGSDIRVALSNLMISGNCQDELQEEPIRLSIDVKMPKFGVGSLDDQAMRVSADISKAKFCISKYQYSQIMNTLEKNIGETALFLRENDLSGQIMTSARESHSGVQLDESNQRIYFTLNIREVSLVLNGQDQNDAIVKLTATKTNISMNMFPDVDKVSMKALLQNLVCEDCRLIARRRQCRFVMNGSKQIDDNDSMDIFQVKYSKKGNETNVDLILGSPQLVLIPDLLSEILLFVGGADDESGAESQQSIRFEEESSIMDQAVHIDSSANGDVIETNLRTSRSSITNITAKTGTCSFILMDLGTQSTIDEETKEDPEVSSSRTQLAERVVTQGIFAASLSTESDINSGQMITSNFEFNSERMEIFTAFGGKLKSPLQILEPASAYASGSLKTAVAGGTEIDIRIATSTSVDFSLSTQNASLLLAIFHSVNDSLKGTENKTASKDIKEPICLTPKEEERIERIATALEKVGQSESFGLSERSFSLLDSRSSLNKNLSGTAVPAATVASGKTKVAINLTMTQATVTFINDLQGMDEALFRISVEKFVAGGDFVSPETLFRFSCNTSILADYFDSSVNLWNRLLVKPWEITIKGSRRPSNQCHRLESSFDLESLPCSVSFSEQFLVSLASAARMWTIYSAATNRSLDQEGEKAKNGETASSKNRNLLVSLPYAISNHSGTDVVFSLQSGSIHERSCPTECKEYFRFQPPKGGGYGGRRVYGQDLEVPKIVVMKAEGSTVTVNMDVHLNQSPVAHKIGDKLILFTRIVKEGKTTVLHLTSNITVLNQTLIPFKIGFRYDRIASEVGRCEPKNSRNEISRTLSATDGIASVHPSNFSIPIPLLGNFQRDWQKYGQAKLILKITPLLAEIDDIYNDLSELSGEISILVSLQEMRRAQNGYIQTTVEVTCRNDRHLPHDVHRLTLQVTYTMVLVNEDHVFVNVSLEPRGIVENKMPLAMKIRTPMPLTFSSCQKEESGNSNETTYCVNPNEIIEVFTPGPRITMSIRTRDNPIAGLELGWLDSGWVDLPLTHEFRLQDPIVSTLPLQTGKPMYSERSNSNRGLGIELYIVQGAEKLKTLVDVDAPKPKYESPNPPFRSNNTASKMNQAIHDPLSFIFTVCNYAVDHTGCILFEQGPAEGGAPLMWQSNASVKRAESERGPSRSNGPPPPLPFGAFSSPIHRRRISLLPNAKCPVRLLQMTIAATDGFRRTMPFMIEHTPLGDGGASTLPILWENKKESGLFAYRHLINEHQSEIHIIPEFIVFNGSESALIVKERGTPEFLVEAGDTGQLRAMARPNGLDLSLNFLELECQTKTVSVANLGLKVAFLFATENLQAGTKVGSVCIETVIDTRGDSRLVVKVGEMKFASHESPVIQEKGLFDNDLCRFRIRWSELQLILNEVEQKRRESWNVKALRNPQNRSKNEVIEQPIMAVIFSRFTVDFQRRFKDAERANLQRSQICVIVHNIQIKDLTPNSHFPVVFESSSDLSVFDLCIRINGPLDAEVVDVGLFHLNLAHKNGYSEKMTLTTSEAYVWRILDLVNRILAASGEVSGFTLKYDNDNDDNYVLKIEDSGGQSHSKSSEKNQYTAPTTAIYNIALARVSPFTVVVSFRRTPDLVRYKKVNNGPGAAVTNYFTRKLKFTIDKAELGFTRYEARNLKGTSGRLIETLSTVYMGRMKYKFVSLLSAASLKDWRFLSGRDGGDDEYVEGDILRATGNLAGKSAGLVFKTVGRGVGGGVARATSIVGESIENASSKIGARKLGSGVNSIVTGVGKGVGATVSGGKSAVGTGASDILQGAGQGVGHVVGGVSGAAFQVGKGIGKAITTGNGGAVAEGFKKGAKSVGGGFKQGAESAVGGTTSGFVSVGKGLFGGIKGVTQGFGGAIRGNKPPDFQRKKKDEKKK